MARIVVGVSGASGIILAYRLLEALSGHDIEFVMTPQAAYTASLELGKEFSSAQKFISKLPEALQKKITIYAPQDVGASICSGSFRTDAMVVVPCSMATLAAIACGLADNTLRRAADVTIKERRPLIIVPREMPLSEIHLSNMLTLSRLGAIILPPIPAWYAKPKSLEEVEQFIVGRILDHLKIPHQLYKEWRTT